MNSNRHFPIDSEPSVVEATPTYSGDDQGEPPIATWTALGLLPKHWPRSHRTVQRDAIQPLYSEPGAETDGAASTPSGWPSDMPGRIDDETSQRAEMIIDGRLPVSCLHPWKRCEGTAGLDKRPGNPIVEADRLLHSSRAPIVGKSAARWLWLSPAIAMLLVISFGLSGELSNSLTPGAKSQQQQFVTTPASVDPRM